MRITINERKHAALSRQAVKLNALTSSPHTRDNRVTTATPTTQLASHSHHQHTLSGYQFTNTNPLPYMHRHTTHDQHPIGQP